MRTHNAILAALFLASAALALHAENDTADRVILASDKTESTVNLTLDSEPSKNAVWSNDPLRDLSGNRIYPQPVIEFQSVSGNVLQVHISQIYFWGSASFKVISTPGAAYTFVLQRGPFVNQTTIQVTSGTPAQLWLYTFDTHVPKISWRIMSGLESVCGMDAQGVAKTNCEAPSDWANFPSGILRSDPIVFTVPKNWFHPFQYGTDPEVRKAVLELRHGAGDDAPVERIPLQLDLHGSRLDALTGMTPPALSGLLTLIARLLWQALWITIGAVFLMLAQVMIPNFQKGLRMEGQIESLQGRLRAISNKVGDRLTTRCHQELESVRTALAMNQTPRNGGFLTWPRIALAGNTLEVNRIAALLPRIETRIHLTELLDEQQNSGDDLDGDLPPTVKWNRDRLVQGVRAILSRQFVTDAEEKAASSNLEALNDPAGSLKDFATELEARVTSLKRQFSTEPWKTAHPDYTNVFPDCAAMLSPNDKMPDGGWGPTELVQRDITAIRLCVIHRMIGLSLLLENQGPVKDGIIEKLGSTDAAPLAEAAEELVRISQQISESNVNAALVAGMWDAYIEPATGAVTDQDVVRASFTFRDKEIDHCAARESFQCYWKIVLPTAPDPAAAPPRVSLLKRLARRLNATPAPADPSATLTPGSIPPPDSDDEEAVYELGWDVQFMPPRGHIVVSPEVYDSEGKPVPIQPESEKNKGQATLDVVAPPSTVLRGRVVRGLLDAVITALVPVVTVAIANVGQGGALPIEKLVLLGFTSQAIRSAIVPDPTTHTADSKTKDSSS